MPKYILITDKPREVEVRDNTAYYIDDGTRVPDELLTQYRSVLGRQNYNAKLLSQLTSTPYHFWVTAADETKEAAWKILEKVVPDLLNLRDTELKKRFAKRSKRALNVRWRKNDEDS